MGEIMQTGRRIRLQYVAFLLCSMALLFGCASTKTTAQPIGATAQARAQAYQALFRAELDAEELKTIRQAANYSGVVGSERFREEIAVMLGRNSSPSKKKGRPRWDDQTAMREEQQELGI